MADLSRLIDAERSDLYDVLAYVAFASPPITREERANARRSLIHTHCNDRQREFLDFVLAHCIYQGVEELDQDKLPDLLRLKYRALPDAFAKLGDIASVRELFVGFQKYLYEPESVA